MPQSVNIDRLLTREQMATTGETERGVVNELKTVARRAVCRKNSTGLLSACVMSICLVFIIVFSTVPALQGHSPVVWGIEAIATLISAVFTYIIWLYIRRHGNEILEDNVRDVTIRMKLVFLWLFGFVNILNSALNMAINWDCLFKRGKEPFPGEQVLSILTHCIEILFNIGQLGFLSSYAKYKLKPCTLLNYGISSFILTHLVRWFRTVFTTLLKNNIISSKRNYTNITSNDCYWHSDIRDFRSTIEPYVEPTLTEYSLLAVALVLRMWIIFEPNQKDSFEAVSINEESPLLLSYRNGHSIIEHSYVRGETSVNNRSESSVSSRSEQSSSIYVCILLAIILCLPILTTVIISASVKKFSVHYKYALGVVQCIFKVELLCVLSLAYFLMSKLQSDQDSPNTFNGGRFILILCTAGSVAYSTFGLIAGMLEHDGDLRELSAFLVLQKLIEIICTYMLTDLIIKASSVRCTCLPYSAANCISIHKVFCVLYTINLIIWIVNSYIGKNSKRIMSVEMSFYREDFWNTVHDVLYPITIFYRFHTAMDTYQLHKKFRYL